MKRLFGIVLGSAVLLSIVSMLTIAQSAYAESSTLFLNVPATTVQEGDRVTVDVLVSSPTQSVNAVSGTLLFPETLVRVIGVSKSNSIINLWTREPSVQRGKIVFEGIMLNPGFQGTRGVIFHVTFEAKTAGTVSLSFSDGAVLANDGKGSNIASALGSGSFKIASGILPPSRVATGYPGYPIASAAEKVLALPVITDYSATVDPNGAAFIKGKGEPNALTKIEFKNTSFKSIGEQFIAFLQTKKKSLDAVIVKNDATGAFEYTTPSNIIAGAYNATPYLVDTKTDNEKPGLGVQLFVSDSPIVRILVIVINVLALLIPVVGLGVVIYFIPWYSFRRMRVLGRRFGLEEEKLKFTTRAFAPQSQAPPAVPPTPSTGSTPPVPPVTPVPTSLAASPVLEPVAPLQPEPLVSAAPAITVSTPPQPPQQPPQSQQPPVVAAAPAAARLAPSAELPAPPYAYIPELGAPRTPPTA